MLDDFGSAPLEVRNSSICGGFVALGIVTTDAAWGDAVNDARQQVQLLTESGSIQQTTTEWF